MKILATVTNVVHSGRAIPGIFIEIELKNDENERISILGYSIDIHICGISIGNNVKFSTLTIKPNNCSKLREFYDITPYIFKTIENQRKGGDVPINISIGILRINATSQLNINSFNYHGINVQPINYKLSERDWISLVSKMGYANYAIFEIRYPDIPLILGFDKIIKRLEEAQKLLFEGRNEEVVTKCRKAFEILNPLVLDKTSGIKAMTSQLSTQIDMGCTKKQNEPSKSERIEELRQKIWKTLHMGPHEGYTLTRDDAELILYLCLSLVRYYSSQFYNLSKNE